jgi:hypothetical protein
MVGLRTSMPHVVHGVMKAFWMWACSGGLLDIPGEMSCLGGGPVVKAKSRHLRREKWSRPGAVGILGLSTCMPHVAHDVPKACWLIACPEDRLYIPRGDVIVGWWSCGRVCTQKAKSRYLRGEKWTKPGAVSMLGLSTCMPHVVYDVNKAGWLLWCPGGLLDTPVESWVVVPWSCVYAKSKKSIFASGKVV